jgi:hypothetical protein
LGGGGGGNVTHGLPGLVPTQPSPWPISDSTAIQGKNGQLRKEASKTFRTELSLRWSSSLRRIDSGGRLSVLLDGDALSHAHVPVVAHRWQRVVTQPHLTLPNVGLSLPCPVHTTTFARVQPYRDSVQTFLVAFQMSV